MIITNMENQLQYNVHVQYMDHLIYSRNSLTASRGYTAK